jgi:hypothetical protein
MYRRVVFALPARQLSGSIVAYGPDAAPVAKPLASAPGTEARGESAPRGKVAASAGSARMVWKELARTRW